MATDATCTWICMTAPVWLLPGVPFCAMELAEITTTKNAAGKDFKRIECDNAIRKL
jgi:hypothetical protein